MSFFNINGWNVPIVNGGMSETSTAFGNTGRSFTNRALINRRLLPRTWTGSMLFQSPSVADTVEGLVSGRGHHFPFDRDAWSDSGVGPTSGTIGNISVSQAGDARFGTGRAELSGDVSFDVGIPANKYTVIIWAFSAPSWFQIVEVNDGTTNDTYVNGVLGGPPIVSSVADGVITLDSITIGAFGSVIDDLVILPFAADSSFIESLYAWQTSNDLAVYLPFEYPEDYVDRMSGTQGTASSLSPTDMASGCQISKSGEGSLFFSNSQDVTYGSANVPQVSNEQAQTIAFWARPEALALTQEVANQIGAPVFPSWKIFFDGNQLTAQRGIDTTKSDLEVVDSTASSDEEWVHFAVVYTADVLGDSTLSLYRNGSLVVSDTYPYAVGLVSRDLVIGGGFLGAIDDFRIYESALSAYQIADIVVQGQYGYGPTLPSERAFSKMPRLLVSGDVIGSQTPKEVIGNVTSEPYVQHGGNYSTNDRAMEFTLQEVKKPRERGISRPDANFILEPEFIRDESNNVHADAIGGYRYGPDGTNFPDLVYDSSFGFCYDFAGVDSGFNIPGVSKDLGGSTAVSACVWFNADAVGSDMGLLSLPIETGATFSKFVIRATSTGDILCGGRYKAGILFDGLTTGGANFVAGEWYFVCGILDWLNQEVRVYSNFGPSPQASVSLLDSKATRSPSQNYFTSEDGGGVKFDLIGAEGVTTANPFNGKIKSVAIWKRAIQEDEIVTAFQKGYDRRIFR